MATDELALGAAALAASRWESARDHFAAALAAEETVEGLDGLGQALWWLGEVARAVELRARAYAGLARRGEALKAARVALWLTRRRPADGWHAPSGCWRGCPAASSKGG